jgi:hypothetical protein
VAGLDRFHCGVGEPPLIPVSAARMAGHGADGAVGSHLHLAV